MTGSAGISSGRLAKGVLLIFVALVAAGMGRAVARNSHHAYDPDANPPAAYRLSLGTDYQLSAPGGVKALQNSGVLKSGADPECFYAQPVPTGDPVTHPLTILSTKDDTRDLDVFATFSVPTSGTFSITCTGVGAVFVDDADDAGTDYSAVLMLAAIVIGLVGVVLTVSGLAGDLTQLSNDRSVAETTTPTG